MTPFAYLLAPVPKIALLPVIMLLVGLGEASRVIVVFLVLFFQFLVAARDGARAVPEAYYLSLASLGARPRHLLRWVTWPAVLPALFTALRVGIATALAVLFFAETFGTRWGLGYFVVESWMRMAYPDLYAGVAVVRHPRVRPDPARRRGGAAGLPGGRTSPVLELPAIVRERRLARCPRSRRPRTHP